MVKLIRAALKPITFLLALFPQTPPPVAAKPVAADPIAKEPGTREPVAAVLVKAIPSAADPIVAKPGTADPVTADETKEPPMTMAAFINFLARNLVFRARFADAPETVLREAGIDPAPYDLPPKLQETEVQGLVDYWTKPWANQPPWMNRMVAPPPPVSHQQFMVKVRADTELRARFRENPADTMLALGVDPTAFRLPKHLRDDEIDKLFAAWDARFARFAGQLRLRYEIERQHAEQARQRAEQDAQVEPLPMPPAPVYGPPPSRPPTPSPPVAVPRERPDHDRNEAPPVAVYGPPPGLFRK